MNRERPRRQKPIDKRKIIFERAGGKCEICGKKLQNNYPKALDSYMTVDHIMPKSLGGTSNLENLRCLCRQCNMDRGNDTDGVVYGYCRNNLYKAKVVKDGV